MKIRFIVDSASDLCADQEADLTVLPLTIHFGDQEYQDGVNLSHREFYEKLIEGDVLPTTSQVPPHDFEQAFQKVREAGEVAIVVTLSSKLSGTYQSAVIAAEEYQDCVVLVDSENVAIGEQALIKYGIRLREQGYGVAAIVEALEREKKNLRVIALLDTLEYLKRGGRISRTAAMAGGLLSIKPVAAVVDGEVVLLGKARGSKQGNNLLKQEIQKSGGVDFEKPYCLGYTGLSDAMLQKYIEDSEELWKGKAETLEICTVGGVIGTHVGPGAIAVAFFAKNGQA